MFSDGKKDKQQTPALSGQNIISNGSILKGDIESNGDFRIDGTIEGNITTSGKIVVGKTGYIKGKVIAKDTYVEGKCDGFLELSGTLTLKSTAVILGEVVTNKLSVEPGAAFNAKCAMGVSASSKPHSDVEKTKKSA